MFSWEVCEIFKNIYVEEHLPTTAFGGFFSYHLKISEKPFRVFPVGMHTFFNKQHFYKQCQAEIGEKSSIC